MNHKFYANLVHRSLQNLDLGRLDILNPSGEIRSFGSKDGDKEIHATIKVRSDSFYKRCVLFGDIGFGESYVNGEWESDNLTDVIRWMILNWEKNSQVSGSSTRSLLLGGLRIFNRLQHLFQPNDFVGSVENISAHYDLSNELFSTFLDQSMTYSCGDFSDSRRSLEEAQTEKFRRLANSVNIQPEDRVLEIGSGWGAFAVFLAENYGCHVTTITISQNQLKHVKALIESKNLSDKISVEFKDYRNLNSQFDKIVSIEMMEALGHKYLPTYFSVLERCLKPNGIVGLQVILCADSRYDSVRKNVDWIQKHIFPGSLLPSLGALSDAARSKSLLQPHSLFDMGNFYVQTLREWRARLNARSEKIKSLGFDDQFLRTWNYYLSYCEAAFWMKHISVAQIVYTRPNNKTLMRKEARE